MIAYAELAVTSNFSFLHGASHPEELVGEARTLGLCAIGIADRNTLAGVVRAHAAAKMVELDLLVGARLIPTDGPSFLCYPTDRAAYGRLSTLLSAGKRRAPKGECHITMADIHTHADGQIMIALPDDIHDLGALLPGLRSAWGDRLYLAGQYDYRGQNRERLAKLHQLSQISRVPLVAINDVLYHAAHRRPLQDMVTCIRTRQTITEAGFTLEAHAERHLKAPQEMNRLFRGFEDALYRTREIADRCRFNLDELRYEYPDETIPQGLTPQQHLENLTWDGARRRYGPHIPDRVAASLRKELALIEELDYAPYFLTVHDIVAWAREQGILCQGRGSAANSAVCFCLWITSVDPDTTSLLFERFLSKERKEPPDIDVDFEHERREEVIQHIYQRYGRHRAALTATVVSYRPRSAVREVCKALGLTEDIAAALAGTVWGSWGDGIQDKHIREAGLDPHNPMLRRAMLLTHQLIGFPRHLSQHVGGFVLTRGPLVETVPIGNGAMADRTFIEWDKDDIETLGIMKMDVLALGMLSCIRKAFDFLKDHKSTDLCLATIPAEDKSTYDMLCRADSLGVFQVESRAQMNMLPRLRPRTFYDLVIEVAIVRPGPIQGDMVHPYLRRRSGSEKVSYPSPGAAFGPPDELERILKRTLGVPLFQEQAMQISIDAAKFTPEEANGLRRAMATFRKVGTIQNYETMMVERMVARGYEREFAQRCFDQVKGFGEYGFPESHAASFALLVYVSSWIKCHHPDVFCAALLNSQPMGFYAPAQIVRDAREHGVDIRPVDVNLSDWDNMLEPTDGPHLAVRLGFRQITGLREDEMETLMAARGAGYARPDDIRRRTRLPRRTLETLAAADAFGSMGIGRREALWAVRGEAVQETLPLFAAADIAEQQDDAAVFLPEMPSSEHVIQDYQTMRLSLKGHPMAHVRERYNRRRIVTTSALQTAPNGARLQCAGVVLIRQRPGSAKGVFFITIEDETGVANIIVWPRVGERYRPILMGARILLVRGRVQRGDGVTHLVADELVNLTPDLALLSEDVRRDPLANVLSRADEIVGGSPDKRGVPDGRPVYHPRNVRVIPNSRDFH
ncbi:error-prone DNA polymerase [Parvularcula sp. LCG005]|uniref:error-prone DNA polymerase n=1 Tax=Parvularcula sp. LCG005 TaxID=3078805 RepID=UPI002941E678|nr:error-prone DNA polymerase [Parvularcula sp. LCG005]WOI52666.1 error-prone DNA polymerase [Parvularcula sp. LCG005]